MSPANRSLTRLFVQGLQVDVESLERGVIDLTVRADQQHKSAIGRLRQHLANALWRAGNLCHPSQNNEALRVVELVVPSAPLDNFEAHLAACHILQRWPRYTANGEACYQIFVAHEGVESEQDRRLAARQFFTASGQKRAHDSHSPTPAKSAIVRNEGAAS